MTEDDMISLVGEDAISGVTPIMGNLSEMPENFLEELVAQRQAFSTIVNYDGKPVYRIIWQLCMNNVQMHVVFAHQIAKKANISWLLCAADKLAVAHKVKKFSFVTSRKALVGLTRQWGAKVTNVELEKSYV